MAVIPPVPDQRLPDRIAQGQIAQGQTLLIHIGKSGGSTCRAAIAGSAVRIDSVVHIRQPILGPQDRCYIIARAPIARAVSAFNWRRSRVEGDARQAVRFPGEAAILGHYRQLSTLAEQLYLPDGSDNALPQGHFRSIHHLGESIGFYLHPLLDRIAPRQVLGVVMQESLGSDLQRLFDVTTTLREKAASEGSGPADLSDRARRNLRRFLARDFACLDRLRDWGLLSREACIALDRERQA